jgi:hypothetical protein
MFVRAVVLLLLVANVLFGLRIHQLEQAAAEVQLAAVPAAAPRLRLLSESIPLATQTSPTRGEGAPTASGSPTIAAIGGPMPMRCFTMGPFRTQAEVRTVSAVLRDQVAKVRRRITAVEEERSYRVYLPATPTREAALTLGAQLRQEQVSDYFVVTSGADNNTISLGVFSTEANAERRMLEVRARGFNAQLEPRAEKVNRYWVDYAVDISIDPDLSLLLGRAPAPRTQACWS